MSGHTREWDRFNEKSPIRKETLTSNMEVLNGGTNYSFQPSLIGTIIEEWYKEYADDYEKAIMSVDSDAPSINVKTDPTFWALQNIS